MTKMLNPDEIYRELDRAGSDWSDKKAAFDTFAFSPGRLFGRSGDAPRVEETSVKCTETQQRCRRFGG
jgi:hypothetical protein